MTADAPASKDELKRQVRSHTRDSKRRHARDIWRILPWSVKLQIIALDIALVGLGIIFFVELWLRLP